ncbi:hypothetical protein PTSG_08265 [Salpingoeca rosetta]|uniref:GCS light chain n=1 Tax=Salpingoeca rosetta (strain ATCC 50818 / BSB-021) TaxID=946362 RepID=F2UIH1_SALR5|nr:uncharacterized protein PTSG_08265 [Salpingoeca rosetta]EGD76920.1 hypothetical protein PTSG_08265 [Salpingoeca rosetta]|eukprot:XP_004991291.1 hypothetical protein PTSG_08265 [Salpingoeca rosetta]
MALVGEKTELEATRPQDTRMVTPTTVADFVIHTGNVQRCNHLQARVPATLQREITTALKCTMQCWKKHNKGDFVMSREVIGHPKLMRVPLSGNAMAKRVRVKLFILDKFEEGIVSKALTGVEKAVGFAGVDTLVVDMKAAGGAEQHEEEEAGRDGGRDLVAAWREMENLHDYGLAKSLGVADLDTDTLQHLASVAKVPVAVNEVDQQTRCASLPSSLRTYAREHGIRLDAHSDAGHPLPKQQFQKIMTKVIKDQSLFTPGGEHTPGGDTPGTPGSAVGAALRVDWTPRWVARYTVVDTERSVVDSTGFVIGGRYIV